MPVLWRRQILAILRLEMRKNLLGRRSFPIYLLAAMPVLLFGGLLLAPPSDISASTAAAAAMFAGVYRAFFLRLVLFFGCVVIFTNLFRGEVLDRSLHYYFLAPIRREVLLAGKFLSGWVTTTVVFAASAGVSFVLLYLLFGFGGAADYILHGPGLGQLLAYLGVTALACLGYGAVFLVVGLYFKNPVVPAMLVLFWEWINFLLPAGLKSLSVVHHLQGLLPVPISEGPFALVAESPSPWISVPGFLVVAALFLALSAVRIRTMEIHYGTD